MSVTQEQEVRKEQEITNLQEETDRIIQETIETKIQEEVIDSLENKNKKVIFIISMLVMIVFLCIAIFLAIPLFHATQETIATGVQIKGIQVEGLTKEEAMQKVINEIQNKMPEIMVLQTENEEMQLDLTKIRVSYALEEATTKAYEVGRSGNIVTDGISLLTVAFQKEKIEPNLRIDMQALDASLEDISAKLPDAVQQSSYYMEEGNLIVTAGKTGMVVDKEKTKQSIVQALIDLSYQDQPVKITIATKQPDPIEIEKIHQEVYQEAKDAYYTKQPYEVHPHINGVDFDLEAAKELLKEKKEEYIIPLTITTPKITTNQIGTEAFPDLLSEFSTKYAESNRDRTTNLKLAAQKINGTVLMPGELFSYNKIVGKRTIAAGYKEAAIYQNGKVVDGLGGGICQISTTLYNAALYANLEIVERRNHQFVPSYVSAGRDATVVYGSTDFQFKNTRNYPIKLVCSVSKGVATFHIFGLKEANEPEVQISSKIVSKTKDFIRSETYQTVRVNGQIVSSGVIHKDTYKRH